MLDVIRKRDSMRVILVVAALLVSNAVHAENICDSSEFVIEPDHQMPESTFSQENAKKASNKLTAFVSGAEKPGNWTVVPNYLKIVEGYLLKKDALEKEGVMKELAVADFCLFMKKKAFIYD